VADASPHFLCSHTKESIGGFDTVAVRKME
jgi:hypothetical protein